MRLSYSRICRMLAAKRCSDAGWSAERIAGEAKVSVRTVKRWLKLF